MRVSRSELQRTELPCDRRNWIDPTLGIALNRHHAASWRRSQRAWTGVRYPSRSMIHSLLYRSMKSPMICRASSRSGNWCRYRHCSFSVRKNRSVIPLHSGTSGTPETSWQLGSSCSAARCQGSHFLVYLQLPQLLPEPFFFPPATPATRSSSSASPALASLPDRSPTSLPAS